MNRDVYSSSVIALSHVHDLLLGTLRVSISRFVVDVPDSVQFHHDIIFCMESNSIVVSFSSGIGFLRVHMLQFWFQNITCYFYCCFNQQLMTEKCQVDQFSSLRKSTKKTYPFSPLKISISILVYTES